MIKDRFQIMLLILSEFKQINELLSPLKSSENLWFSSDFRGHKNEVIRSNFLNIRSDIRRRSITCLTFPVPYISGSCIEIKKAFMAIIKSFESPQRSVKIKI